MSIEHRISLKRARGDGTLLGDKANLSFLSRGKQYIFCHLRVIQQSEVSEQGQDCLGKTVRDFPCCWGTPGLAVIQFIWLLTASLQQCQSSQTSTKPNLWTRNPSPANCAAPSLPAAQCHR